MPPVRTLVAPAVPHRETQSVTAADVGAVPAGVVTERPTPSTGGAIALPSWATPTLAIPQIKNSPAAVYVGQLQPNTGARVSLMAAGAQDGEYYLSNAGVITPLKPFRFFLIDARAYQTNMNAVGDIVGATRDMSARIPDHHEHAVAVILVDTPTGLQPAKCDFRKAQSPAYSSAANGVQDASDPTFPQLSDAAKVAAQFPVPWGRVVTTVTIERRVAKGSGKPYFLSNGTTTPASVSDLQKLAAFLSDPASTALVETAQKSFRFRCDQIEKLCK